MQAIEAIQGACFFRQCAVCCAAVCHAAVNVSCLLQLRCVALMMLSCMADYCAMTAVQAAGSSCAASQPAALCYLCLGCKLLVSCALSKSRESATA